MQNYASVHVEISDSTQLCLINQLSPSPPFCANMSSVYVLANGSEGGCFMLIWHSGRVASPVQWRTRHTELFITLMTDKWRHTCLRVCMSACLNSSRGQRRQSVQRLAALIAVLRPEYILQAWVLTPQPRCPTHLKGWSNGENDSERQWK